MILLVGQFVLKVPGFFLCQRISPPFSETTAFTAFLPLPNSLTSWLQNPSLVAMHEHWLFSRLSAFRPRALSSSCFSYLCQSRGLVTFFAHLTSAQFKAGACCLSVFFLSMKAFLCKQGPQELHLHSSLIAPLNSLRDRDGHPIF